MTDPKALAEKILSLWHSDLWRPESKPGMAEVQKQIESLLREAMDEIKENKLEWAAKAIDQAATDAYADAWRIARESVACNHGENCHRECDCPVNYCRSHPLPRLGVGEAKK